MKSTIKYFQENIFKDASSISKIVPFFLLFVLSLITSCKKFVEVPPPITTLVTENVFNNNNTATAAQTVIYTKMVTSGLAIPVDIYTGWSSDELTNYSTGQTQIDLYRNALTAINEANTIGGQLWSPPYNCIYQANAVIEGLQNYNGVSPNIKQQLTGEAKFTRAFWYFYLVNLFGDVPLLTTTNYQVNGTASKTPKAQVYQQIIADLKDAQNSLSSNYLDATDTVITADRVRPTKWAATALLARVYLYYGNLTGDASNYVNAETQASVIINNSSMFSLVSLNNVFLKNSNEAIWQLMPPPTTYYTLEGYYFNLKTAPTGGSFSCTLSPQLLNAFEPGDNRKNSWVTGITATGNTYYYPYKYKTSSTSTTQSEYSMVLRLAEQYLIRAEARDQQGNTGGAASDLNIIRNRAGLSATTATTQADLLTAIDHERQIELFTEWGDRWFNLKRRGAIDGLMNVITPQKGGASWNTSQQLYPIPLTDINNDPNLKQTPGY